jgi:hypothetical protein
MKVWEENVVEAKVLPSTKMQVEVQQSIEVQAMVESHLRAMEMESRKSEVVAKRKRAILDKGTLLDKDIKIPNPNRFMWT